MEEKVLIAFQCPIDLDKRIRLIAAKMRISKSELIRLAILEYLEEKEDDEKMP